jgi:2-polyprenyl-3-methyl-5-hydroxy-6-metoxy-1,4-benzoquinol methylase
MQCYVCDEVENFESLKEMNPERELLVCKNCGNCCYRAEPQDEAKVLDYYRREYRPQPTWMNLLTCAHKLQYVAAALKDWLQGKQGLVCGDVGTAIGYIPNWLKKMGHDVTASEYTTTFRRFAEHFYGIKVHEELPEKKYDLVTIYHVLEHMIEPDKKLKKYAAMLKPGGRILIATPEWFDTLEEASGSSVTDFTHLFHKDHINVFSRQSIQNLFAKSGLCIDSQDHRIYGQTYLLKAADKPNGGIIKENWEDRVALVKKSKAAIDLFKARKFREAVTLYPKFPEGWIGLICDQNMKNVDRQVDLWVEANAILGDNLKMIERYGIWLYQQERWLEALAAFESVLALRPHENLFIYAGWCLSHLGRSVDSMQAFQRAADLYPMKWQEAMDWICKEACSMPNWEERRLEEEKERVWKEHQAKAVPA